MCDKTCIAQRKLLPVTTQSPGDMMPKRDHERDLELDKKIEALRRKNEVLMKRYKVKSVSTPGSDPQVSVRDVVSSLLTCL